MSYCRFENTAGDLSQCVEDVREANDNCLTMREFLSDMSKYEAPSVEALYEQSKEFIREYEKLKGRVE
jgi:hypothetical protein